MVDALLSKHQFIGYSQEAVLELLGNPEESNYFQDYDLILAESKTWLYIY